MQCLSLADCRLGSLPVEALPRMAALVYLDLAHNPGLGAPLAAAPPTMLTPLTSLGSIVLRGSIRGLRQVRHRACSTGAACPFADKCNWTPVHPASRSPACPLAATCNEDHDLKVAMICAHSRCESGCAGASVHCSNATIERQHGFTTSGRL